MKDIITRKVIKPHDCALALSIPTTRAAFFEALEKPENRDFIPNLHPVWPKYNHEVIKYTNRLLPAINSLGVDVFRDASLADFKALLSRQQHSVIILFAHWKDDSVEFADGLALFPSIVEAVPYSYQGFIDLCVCHPMSLAMELRNARPACVVRFTNAEATPALWLYFYLALFKLLQESRITYLSALETTIHEFLKSGRE